MHTRVSEELDEALQDAARRLRVPVSNLVRNVLEDVFDAVEAVTENVGELVEDVVEEAQDFGRRFERHWRRRTEGARERIVEMEREPRAERRPPEPPAAPRPPEPARAESAREFADVSAWQPVVLNAARECGGCGRAMRRGDPAYLGMGVSGVPPFLCEPCLDREGDARA
ncbi:MAG TPA: ribbon-helix-helix domain-containing protein [Myxococcota bacterium]|nr:ribbon-helix-helix domain-containing protein [Myxococcota bacterium]